MNPLPTNLQIPLCFESNPDSLAWRLHPEPGVPGHRLRLAGTVAVLRAPSRPPSSSRVGGQSTASLLPGPSRPGRSKWPKGVNLSIKCVGNTCKGSGLKFTFSLSGRLHANESETRLLGRRLAYLNELITFEAFWLRFIESRNVLMPQRFIQEGVERPFSGCLPSLTSVPVRGWVPDC